MSLTTARTQHGNVLVLKCAGRLTLGESAVAFRSAVRDALVAGERLLVLDMTDLNYIDSSGIGELVSAYTATRNAGGQLLLAGLTKRVRDLLEITKLYTVFPVFATVEEAVASAQSPQAT